jgi:hypothetical protein
MLLILPEATCLAYIFFSVTVGVAIFRYQAVGAPGSTLCWPSLVATALVAVAFQPVRKQVLRLADRLVCGNRAAPYEALATLGRRLADRSGRPVGRTANGVKGGDSGFRCHDHLCFAGDPRRDVGGSTSTSAFMNLNVRMGSFGVFAARSSDRQVAADSAVSRSPSRHIEGAVP